MLRRRARRQRPHTRRGYMVPAGSLLVVLALVLTGCADAADPDELADELEAPEEPEADEPEAVEERTITVGFNLFWSVPPFFVGRELGYFDEIPGVTVEWAEFDDPTAAIAAIVSGDIEIAAAPGPTLLTARGRGVPVVGVASLAGESDPAQYGFVKRADSDAVTVADLAGETVGVNNFAGNFDLHVRYMLEQEGLDPEQDVDIRVVPIRDVVPAVMEGSLTTGAVVGAGVLFAELNEDLDVLFTSRDVRPLDVGYSFLVLTMGEAFIEADRDAALGFLEAYARAVEFIETNPEDAAELWAANTDIEVMTMIRTMNEFPDQGHVQVEGLAFDLELLERYGYVETEISPEDAVDSSLLDEVLARR